VGVVKEIFKHKRDMMQLVVLFSVLRAFDDENFLTVSFR
jgi:hypothetical protein